MQYTFDDMGLKFPIQHRLKNGEIFTIDRAAASDAKKILEYLELVSGETDNLGFGRGEFNTSEEKEAELLESARTGDLCLYIKGICNDQIVSVLTFRRSNRPRLRHLGEFGLSVLRDYWGQGVGTAMLKCLIDWAETTDVYKIELRVRQDNAKAIALYKKIGFQEEGMRKSALYVHGKYFDELHMSYFKTQSQSSGSR